MQNLEEFQGVVISKHILPLANFTIKQESDLLLLYNVQALILFPLFTLDWQFLCVTNRKITNSPYCTYFYISI